MSDPRTCIVIGGGLAGIAAALRLADRGDHVTLLESRARLGGATASFPRGGLTVDNGHHVFLRCYGRYRSLLARLGVSALVEVQPRLDIPVDVDGIRTRLRRGRSGPAPMHLLPALTGYRALTWRERAAAVRAATALRHVDPEDPATDDTAFGPWLRDHGQSSPAIGRLWGLITVAALNLDPADASLALAAKVFGTGLLDAVAAGDLGLPLAPLGRLHDEAPRAVLGRIGVDVRLRSRVRRVEPAGPDGGFVVRTSGGDVGGDAVVCAVPHAQAYRVLPPGTSPQQEQWHRLGASPIVNVHAHFDRPVLDVPMLATPDSPLQFLFDKTTVAGADRGQYVVASLSAADDVVRSPVEDVLARALPELRAALPGARHAQLLDAFVTREPAATFRQQAGTLRYRPAAHTAVPGLAIAGAWADTGWPDTMEGAVRSGQAAAAALENVAEHHPRTTEVPA